MNNKGYGTLSVDDRDTLAHRFAYAFYHGPIAHGMDVCHRCDTPRCVKIDHLFLGTHAENMADMARKGRSGQIGQTHSRGEGNGHNVLTEAQVIGALTRLAAGERQADIARDLSVSPQVIWHIAHGKTWAHLRAREEFRQHHRRVERKPGAEAYPDAA